MGVMNSEIKGTILRWRRYRKAETDIWNGLCFHPAAGRRQIYTTNTA
jgi:hypothetical protein